MNRRFRLSILLATIMMCAGIDLYAVNENFFDDGMLREELSLKGRPIYFDNADYADWHDKWEYNGMEGDNPYLPQGGRLHYLYLDNRRALTGESCFINKIVNTVTVGSGTQNLGNVLDEDLTNFGDFVAAVNADVTVGPVFSIRDASCYYAKGTTAGFSIVAGTTGSTVLDLSIVKAMAIGFYRDGQLVGTVSVGDGQSIAGVSLSLVHIPGSEDTGIDIVAEAPGVFDEISLDLAGGIQANAGRLLRVKYGFVGKPSQSKIKRTTDEGYVIDKIQGYNPVILGLPFPLTSGEYDKFFSDDDTEGAILSPVLGLAFMGSLEWRMKDPEDPYREVYTAGSDVTFEYRYVGVASLDVGSYIEIKLYDRKGNEVQTSRIEAGVLGLDLIQVGKEVITITAQKDFSGAKLSFYGGLKVGAGGFSVVSSNVRSACDTRHHCPINPTASTSVCPDQNSFQLRSNPEISVTWSLVSQPPYANAKVTAGGKVTDMFEPGEYRFRATAADGCWDETVLTIWDENELASQATCGTPMINTPDGRYGRYSAGQVNETVQGGLVPIDVVEHIDALVDEDTNNAAKVVSVNLLNNNCYVGIMREDDYIFDANKDVVSSGKRVGFMVSSPLEVVKLKALQFLQIRCYDVTPEGTTLVYQKPIDESNAVSADVAGANNDQKWRYSVSVPNIDDNGKPMKFNAFELWTSGVLGIDHLNIHYAFVDDLDNDACSSPFGCETRLLNYKDDHTTINFNGMTNAQGLSVAGGYDNIGCLIDGDMNTYCNVFNVAGAAGTVFDITLGRTLDFRQKLGLVMDENTFLAGVQAGAWLTMETYYKGIPTGDKFTDWDAVNADVAGYGDKRVLFISPKTPYDEVKITIGKVLDVANVDSRYYGFGILSDIDNDGIPDCRDFESCVSDVQIIDVVDVCATDEINIIAKGNLDTDYYYAYGTGKDLENLHLYHTATDSDLIDITFNVGNEPGIHTIVFYDGSKRPIQSGTYVVHPTETTWKKNASNGDWSKWDNWTDGSPYCCTNVIIPSGARIYPDLADEVSVENADAFCCDKIHFQPGARISSIQNLNYNQAWVEMELTPNRYHLLSAPLKEMVTGDIFIPAEMKGVHTGDYFVDVDSVAAPQNRFDPTIYQRRWYSAVNNRNWETEADKIYTTLDKLETIDGITTTKWSKNFNLLNYGYALGEGFSVWVDNGALPESTDFRFRFPKTHTRYTYFNDFTGEPIWGIDEEIARSAESNRFIYENPENVENVAFNKTICERTYDRTVYTGAADLTLNVEAEESTGYFLLGNPYMSSMNIEKLIETNKEIISGVMLYDGNVISTIRRNEDGTFARTTAQNYISPMQAAFLIANEDKNNIQLQITPEILKGDNPVSDEETDEPEALRIRLRDGVHESAALISANSGAKGNLALLDNEVAPALAVMAICEGKGYDIIPALDRIPLTILKNPGEEAYLDFNGVAGFDMESYQLLDVADNKTYTLDEGVTLSPETAASAGRYVLIRKTGISTNVDINADFNSDIYVEVTDGEIKVISNNAPIADIMIATPDGKVESTLHNVRDLEATLPITPGVKIITVTSEGNHRPTLFKIMVK